jgi:hypothetical protein
MQVTPFFVCSQAGSISRGTKVASGLRPDRNERFFGADGAKTPKRRAASARKGEPVSVSEGRSASGPCAAVLGNLVDVGAFHEAHAIVGVS